MAGLAPSQRFTPSYYAGQKYVIDPATGRVVLEGQVGQTVSAPMQRYSELDIATAGLPGANGPATAASAPAGQSLAGGAGGEPGGGAEGRAKSESPATGPGEIPGGFSTVLGLAGTLAGVPGAGLAGSAIDTVIDKVAAERFDPEYEGDLGKWGSAFVSDVTSGLLGRSHKERAIDEYQERTGTGLNDAALGAAKKGGYSGPKGVVGNKGVAARDKALGGLAGGGGGAERGGADQGHGGGGQLGGDRDKGFGGPR